VSAGKWQLMPEFDEKGKENFTHQFDFFTRFSVLAIKKVKKADGDQKFAGNLPNAGNPGQNWAGG